MTSSAEEEEFMEILSMQTIKPSSPTPIHLRNFNLSLLDQMVPPFYFHLIFYYESPNLSQAQTSQTLKHSLSNVLTDYPILAGRFNPQENHTIECDDSGVEYVEVRVHSRLSITLEDPDPIELRKYVEVESIHGDNNINPNDSTLFGVQVNFFDCGGIAVGVRILHKIADVDSLVGFMNAWARLARNEKKTDHDHDQKPIFNLHTHFPPVDHLSKLFGSKKPQNDHFSENNTNVISTTRPQKSVSKRFVFDKEMLLRLKETMVDQDKSSHFIKDPTKFEALAAFILRNLMISTKEKHKMEKNHSMIFVTRHAVNLRSRTNPTLPKSSFGNACLMAIATLLDFEDDQSTVLEYPAIVTKLRNASKEIDSDLIRKSIEKPDEHLVHYGIMDDLYRNRKSTAGSYFDFEVCFFSTWCRFPVYEVNYGWGDPLWVSTIGVPAKNIVIVMDTKCGEGREAWVNMGEQDMENMEKSYQKLMEASKKI